MSHYHFWKKSDATLVCKLQWHVYRINAIVHKVKLATGEENDFFFITMWRPCYNIAGYFVSSFFLSFFFLPSISDIYTCRCRTARIMKDHASTDWEIICKATDTHNSL